MNTIIKILIYIKMFWFYLSLLLIYLFQIVLLTLWYTVGI